MNPPYHLQFTEEMKGFFGFGEADFQRGFDQGRQTDNAVMFHLTMATEDTYAFIADATHVATASGYVRCDALGGRRAVERGVFNLFVDAGQAEGEPARHMLYRLWFRDTTGRPLTLTGFKDIHHPAASLSGFGDVWAETTTLYTRILDGHVEAEGDAEAGLVGSGVIHILPLDFARQCTTFRVRGPGLAGRAQAFAAFGDLFAGQLWSVFRPRLPGRTR